MKFSIGDGSHNTPAVSSGHFCDTKGLDKWENTLKERKRLHRKLGKKLQRAPGELLMNTTEELRHVKEEKLILGYTKIPQQFDKYRGNPAFWKLPTGLLDKCDPTLDPTYFFVKSKEEKNKIPQLEYITVPDYIIKEKDILPRVRNMQVAWKMSQYRHQRSEQVKSKIKFIEPHKPQLEEVIVIGKKIGDLSELFESATSINVTDETCVPSCPTTMGEICGDLEELDVPRLRFVLNGTIFSERMSYSSPPIILMDFTYDVLSNKIFIKNLTLENTGTATIHLSWNRYKKFDLFSNIKLTPYEIPKFSFDINDIILVPHQKLEVPIMIRAVAPISFSEEWKITSEPNISHEGFYILLKLKYNGFIRGLLAKSNNIQNKLETKAKNNIIKEVIRDILASLRYTDKHRISLKYSEEQLFESINYNHTPFNSEAHYVYNRDIVSELKNLYYEIRREKDPEEWNLCIKDLKELGRLKDLAVYLEKKAEKTATINDKRTELEKLRADYEIKKALQKSDAETKKSKGNVKGKASKTKKDGSKDTSSKKSKKSEDKSSGSKDSKKGKKGKKEKSDSSLKKRSLQSKSDIGERSYYQDLKAILKRLKQPSMIINTDRLKYFHVYCILGSYITKICDSVETLQWSMFRSNFVSQFCPLTHPRERPERLIYEYFDETLALNKSEKIPLRTFPKPTPKPDSVEDIPEENVDQLHIAYFGAEKTEVKKGDKVKGKKSKTSKGSKSSNSSKGKTSDTKPSKQTKTNGVKKKAGGGRKSLTKFDEEKLDFDPFAQESEENDENLNIPPIVPQPEPRGDLPYLNLSNAASTMWQENLYLTFYTLLCEAVDNVTEVCDQFLDENASALLVREAKKRDTKGDELTAEEYNELVFKKIPYPPEETNPETDENIRTYLIKEIVRPTKSETRGQTSLWSLLQNYTPIPRTPPEIIPTPEQSIVEEPKTKEIEIEAMPLNPECDDLIEKYRSEDDLDMESSLASDEESPVEFHYYYVDDDDEDQTD